MEVASKARENRHAAKNPRCVTILATILSLCLYAANDAKVFAQTPVNPSQRTASPNRDSGLTPEPDAAAQLQLGTTLTRKGSFREAIPHLLAAREQTANDYAANFNLALCYVATSQFHPAIDVLSKLRAAGHDSADVENLLAQAYIGNADPQNALAALQKAANLSPQNEKLYAFVADACMDHTDYELGLKVLDVGLNNLPQSAVLHYERAMFLIQLDQPDQAKPQFELARQLASGSEIGYLAAAQQYLIEGEIPDAIRSAREGVKQGYENPALLTVLGEALIRSGVTPGQSDFVEAQTALENAIAQRPNDPAAQIALGSLYLTAGRLDDAIQHLETARQLDPGKASVYASLAKAYQRLGDEQRAQEALATLEELNREQAEHIRSAPSDRKLGYSSQRAAKEETVTQHQ